MVIPGGGAVTKLTVANDGKNRFKLTGPAPLDSTKPVACGDAGCVYNHLDWTVGNGATIIRDCRTNQSECIVTVPRRLASWAVVYVRQNNDPKQLWAIWNSGRRDFTISGTIKTTCHCNPLGGVTVEANGSGGSGSAETSANGDYSISVPEGTYSVRPKFDGLTFTPPERRVEVADDRNGVNFTGCTKLPGPASDLATNRSARPAQAGGVVTYSGKTQKGACPQQFFSFEYAQMRQRVLLAEWTFTPVCTQNGRVLDVKQPLKLVGDPNAAADHATVTGGKFYIVVTAPVGIGHVSAELAPTKKPADTPRSLTITSAKFTFNRGSTVHCLNATAENQEIFLH